MHFNAIQCIVQPNTALHDCTLYLYTMPMIQAFVSEIQSINEAQPGYLVWMKSLTSAPRGHVWAALFTAPARADRWESRFITLASLVHDYAFVRASSLCRQDRRERWCPSAKTDCTGQAGDQSKNVSGSWDPRPALAGWPNISHRNARQHANDTSDRTEENHRGGIESEASCVHKSFYLCQGTLGTQDRACNPGPAWQDCHPACDLAHCFAVTLPSAISTLRSSTHCVDRVHYTMGCSKPILLTRRNALQVPTVPQPRVQKFGKLFDASSECIAVGGHRG